MQKAFSKKTFFVLLALCLLLCGTALSVSAADPTAEPKVVINVETSVAPENKVLAMQASGTVNEGFRSPWKCFAGAKNQKYRIDIWLPEVEGTRVELFSLNLNDTGTPANNQSYTIIDGVVNTSYGETLKYSGSALCVPFPTKENPLVLEAKTWYTFAYDYDIITGDYTATVTEKASSTVVGTQTGVRPEKLSEITASGTTRLLTIIRAHGFTNKIMIDNIDVKGVNDAGNPTAYSAFSANMEAATLGVDCTDAKVGVLKLNNDLDCKVAAEDDYLLIGEVETLTPEPIKMTFSNVDTAILTPESIKLLADGEAVDETAYTVIVENNVALLNFEVPLLYDMTYSFDLSELGITATQSFSTPADPFVHDISTLLNGATDTEVYGVPAAGGSVKGSVTLTNGDTVERSCLVVLALYEGDKLVAGTAKPGTIGIGVTDSVTTEALTVPAGDITAKVIILNGWENTYAMAPAYTVE